MKVFDDEEIRDTEGHDTSAYRMDEMHTIGIKKSLIYLNTLNKICILQLQGSVDAAFTNPVPFGIAISAAASMSEALYKMFSDYFPFIRVEATCAEAPASGVLNAWIVYDLPEAG